MATVKEFLQRLEELEKAMPEELDKLVMENEKFILDLNKQQLFKGEDADGLSLGQYASAKYAGFKRMLNPNGVVDLFLSGRFYDGMFLRNKGFPI
jgi:hypothetical protein